MADRGFGNEELAADKLRSEKLRISGSYGKDLVVRNARVVSAEIMRDLTHTTVEVQLDYGSEGSQSAGVHLLTDVLVRGLMVVAGVDKWSDLPGRVVRARASRMGGVEAVGHVLEEVWLDLKKGAIVPPPGEETAE
jgi:hypothetical protein